MRHVKALVFDWAGTTVDFGCQGPVQAFVESFADFDVAISPAEARGPMGMGKREHVAALLALPRIGEAWQSKHGPHTQSSIDAVYACVEASMLSCITRYCTPIEGTLKAIAALRQQGLRIGSCTGYPRSVGLALAAEAKKHGYEPDLMVCATDVAQGRPAPDMCQAVLSAFGISQAHQAVKVGDTVNDVLEGLHAGMWVIGLTLCGSLAGLSPQEVDALAPAERAALEADIAHTLHEAGAHYTAPNIIACLPILEDIDRRAQAGERP